MFGTPPEIAASIAARVGVPAAIAIASNPDCAQHCARGFAGVTIVPRGQECAALAPLPINLLQAPPEIAETFDQWGIRTFGELAALPPLGVAARLGNEGTRLWQLARGEWDRLLNSARDPLRFSEELELDYPVELLEPLAFLLSRMLHDLCARLHQASLAASEIRLRLTLETGAIHARALRFPAPMIDPIALLKLLQLDLQGQPPTAPVIKLSLEAEPARPRTQQHGLFQPLSPEPEKMELTIARIAAFVGAGNIGTPQMKNTHRPDAFEMVRFRRGFRGTCSQDRTRAGGPYAAFVRRALRRCQLSGGRPVNVRSLSISGVVQNCAGPWRTSG